MDDDKTKDLGVDFVTVGYFGRRDELLGEVPVRKPSPGPWSVKKHNQRSQHARDGHETVWVVLDARGKYVAECDSAVDAYHIADMCTGGGVP